MWQNCFSEFTSLKRRLLKNDNVDRWPFCGLISSVTVSPAWQIHTVAMNYFLFIANVLATILCLSRFWQNPVFFFKSQTNLNINEVGTWLKLLLWCFFLTVKKVCAAILQKKLKKDSKAFPSSVSVHCQHIKYSMWFLLCERNEKGKRESGIFALIFHV